MIELSEYEQQYLKNKELFYWKQLAEHWQMQSAKYRRLYHEMAVACMDLQTPEEEDRRGSTLGVDKSTLDLFSCLDPNSGL